MKKYISILLAVLMLVSAAACGAAGTPATPTPAPATAAPAETEEMDRAAPEVPEEPEETEAPAEPEETEAPAEPEETEAPAEPEKPAGDSPVGVYKMTSLIEDGEESEELATLIALGFVPHLVMEANGEAYLDVFGERSTMAWEDGKIWYVEDGKEADGEEEEAAGGPIAFTYADGILTMSYDGESMSFIKLTAEELADYEKNGSGNVEDFFGGLGDLIDPDDLDIGEDWGEDWGEPQPSDIPEGEPSEGPVSGTVEGFPVTILGAEALEADGEHAIRFYFEFTNNSDEPSSAFSPLFDAAAQDGFLLNSGWLPEEAAIPEDDCYFTNILPGKTIRCTRVYFFDPEGGTVAFRLSDWDDEAVIYYADPQNLSGPPAEPFVIAPDPEAAAALTEGLETATDTHAILRWETGEDSAGAPALRVYFSFTNDGEEETSLYAGHTPRVFQDGYELDSTDFAETVPEDENMWADIAPGETIECSMCYALRSDSPVAILLFTDMTGDAVGMVAELS